MKTRLFRDAAVIAAGSMLAGRTVRRVVAMHDTPDGAILRKKLQWLKRKWRVVASDAFVSAKQASRPMVCLTFDDGYRNWHEVAAPILEELEIPAIFFVTSGFVGLPPQAARDFVRSRLKRQRRLQPLQVSQLRELASHHLFEIGSHTRSHADLGRQLGQAELEAEIQEDREQIEDWIGERIRWFAFPFGGPANISRQACNYLRQSGFKGSFTLVPQSFQPGQNLFGIGRDSLEADASNRLWSAWLHGGYDALYRLKSRLKGTPVLDLEAWGLSSNPSGGDTKS